MELQRIKGNWAYCLEQLGKRKLADASQGMRDRIKRGTRDREHFESGAWFADNFLYVKYKGLAFLGANPLCCYSLNTDKSNKREE